MAPALPLNHLSARSRGVGLGTYLASQAAKLETLLQCARRNPRKSVVHQLRVTMRRIRTILWLTKKDPSLPPSKRLSGKLRRLGKALGELREIDIALENARAYNLNRPKLHRRRREAAEAIKSLLTLSFQRSLNADLHRMRKSIQKRKCIKTKPGLKTLVKRTAKWMHEPVQVPGDLHKLRIDLKKIRYALETQNPADDRLKKLQDILGRLHDLEMIQAHYGKRASVHEKRRLKKKARTITPPTLRFAKRDLKAMLARPD